MQIPVLTICVALAFGAGEERYDGRTLAEWRVAIKRLAPKSNEAAAAVPGLIAIVKDADLPQVPRQQAAMMLGRIGEPAAKALPIIAQYVDLKPANDDRGWALKAISLFGEVAADETPNLIRVSIARQVPLRDRIAAVDALAQIGAAHPRVIPTLIGLAHGAMLRGTKGQLDLQILAVDSLAIVGPVASAAIPTLVRHTGSQHELLRRRSAVAIGAMSVRADIAIDTLAEMVVFDESPAVRDAAAIAMAQVGLPSIRPLTNLLADRDPEVAWRAAHALGTIGRRARSSVGSLRKLVTHQSADVRLAVIEAMIRIERRPEAMIPQLVQELSNRDRQQRIAAFRLLVGLGSTAREAIPLLEELKTDERAFVRSAAEKAIQKIESDSSS